MAADRRALQAHLDWLGFLQPVGLVVSATALVQGGVVIEENATSRQEDCRRWLTTAVVPGHDDPRPVIADLAGFVQGFLGWSAGTLLGLTDDRPVPDRLAVPLPDLGEVLRPDFVFCDPPRGPLDNVIDDAGPDSEALLLVRQTEVGLDLDRRLPGPDNHLGLSPQQRFERLLRETGVAIGLLSNGTHLRLVYAPGIESAGQLTWPVAALGLVDGRPLVSALYELLNEGRLLVGRAENRLPALLQRSREIQSEVSTRLAGQVLEALHLLLQGFQQADAGVGGALLGEPLREDPERVYAGLLSVLMRLVFLLYAEDRGLLPDSDLYREHYGVHALALQLRDDRQNHPDTMPQRTGAWARLLALFGAVHGGCRYPELSLPARLGHLFDPASYPFLAGETLADGQLPRVSDDCVEQVLDRLLMLDGERLSYRTLDVEEIGSVYQAIMGFTLQQVTGPTLALGTGRSASRLPTLVNLDELLATAPAQRANWLKKETNLSWTGQAWAGLQDLQTIADCEALLHDRIARWATPRVVPAGGWVLQPTEERRNTGSHYTPRKLTEPVVRKTLAPILAQLGEHPNPSQILDLKVLDPACGSGAFLVEACRQLGAAVVRAWETHGGQPPIPADETPELYAMRLVAQRCLYGVDINPTAVNLCKLSLWLATLSKDQPFTFLDHAIRTGDALVGLSRQQIAGFTWGSGPLTLAFGQQDLDRQIAESVSERLAIINAPDTMTSAEKIRRLRLSDDRLDRIRQIGNLCLAAFFNGNNASGRKRLRKAYLDLQLRVMEGDTAAVTEVNQLRKDLGSGEHPVTPFHWEIEFPEVFAKGTRQGFDAVIGNPPFLGGKRISTVYGTGLRDWLKDVHEESSSNTDLAAHFFRRAFTLLREDGCLGLVATNTVAQGDTREGGLRYICTHGGTIYDAVRRYPWDTGAAVVASTVCIARGVGPTPCVLDGLEVPLITAFLRATGGHATPAILRDGDIVLSQGSIVLGMGFTFDNYTSDRRCSRLEDMYDLISIDQRNASRIFPYIGGDEVNKGPVHSHRRYVVNFAEMDNNQAQRWPAIWNLLHEKIRHTRTSHSTQAWWRFERYRPELYKDISDLSSVYAISRVSTFHIVVSLPSSMVYSEQLVIAPSERQSIFMLLQSRPHELWARFMGSSLGDGARYTPTDCFETFPFPPAWEGNEALQVAGEAYYAFREEFMRDQWVGLTQTYNLFHHPDPALALDRLWAKRESLPDWRDAERVTESMARHLRPSALEETRRWQCARDGVPYDWTPTELRSLAAAGSRTIYPTVSDAVRAIERLRELHATMDRAVADAYGWTDLDLQCVFTPEHSNTPEEVAFPTAAEALEWQATQDEPIKWRYRWGEALHDEVLMRLMRLNEERAREEARGW